MGHYVRGAGKSKRVASVPEPKSPPVARPEAKAAEPKRDEERPTLQRPGSKVQQLTDALRVVAGFDPDMRSLFLDEVLSIYCAVCAEALTETGECPNGCDPDEDLENYDSDDDDSDDGDDGEPDEDVDEDDGTTDEESQDA